jgi:hypothetical protein
MSLTRYRNEDVDHHGANWLSTSVICASWELSRLRSLLQFGIGPQNRRGSIGVGDRRISCLLAAFLWLTCGTNNANANDAGKEPAVLEQRGLAFLKKLPREWSGTSDHDCKTYEDKNIDRLTKSFAASASDFLRAFRKVHGAITITSAHRTVEEQTCVCVGEKGPCAGRPRLVKTKKKGRRVVVRSTSHHQLGIALDVRPGTGSEEEFICLQEFAQFNPQFGVRFPFGRRDYPHMEPGGAAGAVRLAAVGVEPAPLTPCTKMRIMLTHDHVD